MKHADDTYVRPTRIHETIAEKAVGVDIIHPHLRTLETLLVAHLLNGATRNQKLLESTGIQFVEQIETFEFHTPLIGRTLIALTSVKQILPETSHNAFDQRAYEIVGDRSAPVVRDILAVGDNIALSVGPGVAPLASIGEILQSVARGADCGTRFPGVTGPGKNSR